MKKLILYYFFFLLSFLTIFSSGIVDSIDGLQYLAVARNIYYKGEPTAPLYEYNNRKNVHMSTYVAKDGKTYSLTGLGYSISYLPAVFVTDIVYKIFNIYPSVRFPLENDWLILLNAGFTNAFFGALLGVVLFIYFIALGLNKRQALFLSFVSIISTNLFVYTKHATVHMMFISFMMLSFLMLKLYSINKKKYTIFFAGAAYGIVSISYNPTFLLLLPPLILYYILIIKPKINLQLFQDLFFSGLGYIPFAGIFIWFENLRAMPGHIANFSYTSVINVNSSFPMSVFIEGLHGQLFSPGRSIFIYTPLLLVIIFFWQKIKKELKPEFLAFLLLSLIYILFYAAQYRIGSLDQGIVANWHGETSWGPRYLTPVIPLGMLIVGSIYQSLSKKLKYLIFYPLMIIGLYIELLGVLVPYQTKLHNMQYKIFLNGTEYHAAVYTDLLPRHNPIINMSKNLTKLVNNLPKTLDRGIYNVKYYDGIEFPFNVGVERWREVAGKGYISFDNNVNNPVNDLSFAFINHPISESSESAKIKISLNSQPLLKEPVNLAITERTEVKVPIEKTLLKQKGNDLMIEVFYDDPQVLKMHKQILGFLAFDINFQRQNMESLDFPYVSQLGSKMPGVTYKTWGGLNQDLWKLWELHSQIFERVPDLWWVRSLYHWDIPKSWILVPFATIVFFLILSSYKLLKSIK